MAEADDSLERLNAVVNEIEAHTHRLIRQAKLKNATPDSLMQELSETTMPLLKDFAVRIFAEVLSVRQYIHEHVEPALMQVNANDSMLLPDDATLITTRLLSYRQLLEGLKDRAVGEDRAKMETELGEVDKALARVAEITLDPADSGDPDDDNDDDDDHDDGEGAEDDEPGAKAN
jgi:hypothetical protein